MRQARKIKATAAVTSLLLAGGTGAAVALRAESPATATEAAALPPKVIHKRKVRTIHVKPKTTVSASPTPVVSATPVAYSPPSHVTSRTSPGGAGSGGGEEHEDGHDD